MLLPTAPVPEAPESLSDEVSAGRLVLETLTTWSWALVLARTAIDETISYLEAEHGPEEWEQGMHPEIPEHETLANPYQYREDASTWKESG